MEANHLDRLLLEQKFNAAMSPLYMAAWRAHIEQELQTLSDKVYAFECASNGVLSGETTLIKCHKCHKNMTVQSKA